MLCNLVSLSYGNTVEIELETSNVQGHSFPPIADTASFDEPDPVHGKALCSEQETLQTKTRRTSICAWSKELNQGHKKVIKPIESG